MRSTIYKTVTLPALPETLYSMYIDSATHSAFTGAPASVSEEPGAPFEAFGGLLTGTMLQTVKSRLIVQSWRSVNFAEKDPDSTLILAFGPEDEGEGRIDLVHLDVPENDFQGVSGGWESRYFAPWLEYLQRR